ncbi:hypothetical protein WN51_03160 [Melipona quadrifasciata]|uniref:Uncharacterized protein n=1 Tax=Melipona quadrifasciata TaxID=166423 RepID=A0A0N0BEK6_9HYME|nr:hypothetical protein WN51_03160 [Melipona quadrifasciata]
MGRARMDSFNRMCSTEYDIELILSINVVVTQEVLINPGLLNWVTTNMDTGQLTTNCLCVTIPTVTVISRVHLRVEKLCSLYARVHAWCIQW